MTSFSLLCALIPGLALADPREFDIAPQALASALNRLAAQGGLQVIFDGNLVQGKSSRGVNGRHEPEAALSELLQGSGLTWRSTGTASVTLEPATQSSGALELGATSIVGQAYSSVSPDDGYVAKRSSVGSKTDTPLIETPASVSVITREQIEAQQPKTVAQALRYTPGVNTELAGPQFVVDQLSIRGFQQGTGRMLRDGTRTFLPEFLGWDAPEPYGLERIEVLRGASSVLYGASDPGGQINLVPRPAWPAGPRHLRGR